MCTLHCIYCQSDNIYNIQYPVPLHRLVILYLCSLLPYLTDGGGGYVNLFIVKGGCGKLFVFKSGRGEGGVVEM